MGGSLFRKEGHVMSNTQVTKNYFADNGDELVIGGKLTVLEGATVKGLENGGSYTLPVASADTLGGVKIGSGLTITDGVLSADGVTPAAYQAGSEASTIAALKEDFNRLLDALKAAGLVEASKLKNQGDA